MVSAKDTAPYLVPNIINVACDKDQEVCVACPIYAAEATGEKGTVDVEIPVESPKLLDLVDVPSIRMQSTLRRVCGVPERCPSVTCRSKSTINLEEVRLIPQIDIARNERLSAIRKYLYPFLHVPAFPIYLALALQRTVTAPPEVFLT